MVLFASQVTKMLASSSNQRNLAKDINHTAAKRKLVKVLAFLASFTIAWSISTVNRDFLQMGLARVLLSSSNVAWIKGELVGEGIPAMECTYASSPLTASSTTDFEAFDSPKCCRYRAKWDASTEKTASWCSAAHTFQRLNAPKYFLVVEVALLCRTDLGNASASFCRSAS